MWQDEQNFVYPGEQISYFTSSEISEFLFYENVENMTE